MPALSQRQVSPLQASRLQVTTLRQCPVAARRELTRNLSTQVVAQQDLTRNLFTQAVAQRDLTLSQYTTVVVRLEVSRSQLSQAADLEVVKPKMPRVGIMTLKRIHELSWILFFRRKIGYQPISRVI